MSERPGTGLALLLKLRKTRHDVEAHEFTSARGRVREISAAMEQLREALDQQNKWANQSLMIASEVSQAMDCYRRSVNQIRQEWTGLATQLQSAQANCDGRLQRLLEAHRQKKAAQALAQRLQRRSARQDRLAHTKQMDDLHAGFVAASAVSESEIS